MCRCASCATNVPCTLPLRIPHRSDRRAEGHARAIRRTTSKQLTSGVWRLPLLLRAIDYKNTVVKQQTKSCALFVSPSRLHLRPPSRNRGLSAHITSRKFTRSCFTYVSCYRPFTEPLVDIVRMLSQVFTLRLRCASNGRTLATYRPTLGLQIT